MGRDASNKRTYGLEAGLEPVLGGGELRGERLHAGVEVGQEAQLRLMSLLDLHHELLAHLPAHTRTVQCVVLSTVQLVGRAVGPIRIVTGTT